MGHATISTDKPLTASINYKAHKCMYSIKCHLEHTLNKQTENIALKELWWDVTPLSSWNKKTNRK